MLTLNHHAALEQRYRPHHARPSEYNPLIRLPLLHILEPCTNMCLRSLLPFDRSADASTAVSPPSSASLCPCLSYGSSAESRAWYKTQHAPMTIKVQGNSPESLVSQ